LGIIAAIILCTFIITIPTFQKTISSNKRNLPKLYRLLYKWKFHMAKLNAQKDIYLKTHYKVVEYIVKTPNTRVTEITQTPYGYRRWLRRQQARRLCLMHITHNNTQHIHSTQPWATTKSRERKLFFDTDSFTILVDNCCSKSIANNINDFIDKPRKTMTKIKGYNGLSDKPLKVGTVRWSIRDDKGKIHQFILPNTYNAPEAETRLFSPQHWAQTINNGRQTKCIAYHDAIVLQWEDGLYSKTIPISQHTNNVAMMTTAPGITTYTKLCQQMAANLPCLAVPTTIHLPEAPMVTDDEDEELRTDHPTKATKIHETNSETPTKSEATQQSTKELQLKSSDDQPIQVTYKEPEHKDKPEQPKYNDERQEYIKWHYKLNHASQSTMQRMAQRKFLPHFITRILRKMDKTGGKSPMCNDCCGAAACKTQWRHKAEKKPATNKRTNLVVMWCQLIK